MNCFLLFQNLARTSLRSLRLATHRKALVWQKTYLMLLIKDYEIRLQNNNQEEMKMTGKKKFK